METVTEAQVVELRGWVLTGCDELTVALYLIGKGETGDASQKINEAIGMIEASMAVFLNGGLDS